MQSVLVLDTGIDSVNALNAELCAVLESSDSGLALESAHCSQPHLYSRECSDIMSRLSPDATILLLQANAVGNAQELLCCLRKTRPAMPIIAVIPSCEPEQIFKLLKLGMSDFLTTPLRGPEILPRLWRLLHQRREDKQTIEVKETLGFRHLIGRSPKFLTQVEKLPLMASCDASILILGETGTGKEICARAIHYLSPRSPNPLIPVNCSAIPADLMENELFGHEAGAFTGASAPQAGLIQEADGGTLFLDEIDCLPLLSQVKLLRFIQEREYRRLGSAKLRHADVRLIAASNANIEEAVRTGKLRLDLYYRLNVIPLNLPALRNRQEDIPLLALHFLKKYAAEFRREVIGLSADALQTLSLYQWPGNVRELEHVIERAIALAEHPVIGEQDIVLPTSESPTQPNSFREAKANAIGQFERNYVQGLLVACQGNITKAAKAAHKDRRAFFELVRKHHIDVQALRPAIR